MNDFSREWKEVGSEVLAAVQRVGESAHYILGPEVAAFEQDLAKRWGSRWAIGVANGTDAIEIALRAAGLRTGQEVITTPVSAFATTLAILRAGGVPVFCDVDESGGIDLGEVEQALRSRPTARFLVPVHLYGHALDLERLARLRDRYELKIIEDCAQAIDAQHGGKKVGSVGLAASVSFYPTKNLGALGDAGAILTDDEAIAARCRALRDYGQEKKYDHRWLGLNSRLDELQAGILSALLGHLSAWTERRRRLAERYESSLRNDRLRIISGNAGSRSVFHLFPIRLADPAEKAGFIAYLSREKIQTGQHYPFLIPELEAMREVSSITRGTLSRARELARGQVSLPIHPYLDETEIEAIVTACNTYGH